MNCETLIRSVGPALASVGNSSSTRIMGNLRNRQRNQTLVARIEPSAARPQPNKNDSQKITKFAKLDALTLASFAPFCSKSLSEKQEIAGKQCGSNTDGRQGSTNGFVKSVFCQWAPPQAWWVGVFGRSIDSSPWGAVGRKIRSSATFYHDW